MAFKFPYTSLQEINLDWILEKVKKFAELIPPMEEATTNVQEALDMATEALDDATQAVTSANEAIETANEAKEIAEEAAQGVIADDSVTTSKIHDDAVTTPKIDDEAVTTDKIDDGAITNAKLAANAVNSFNIANGSISISKLHTFVTYMLGYTVVGDSSEVSIAKDKYVVVKESNISGVSDGLYKTLKTVPADTTLDSSYFTLVQDGGFNDILDTLDIRSYDQTNVTNVNQNVSNLVVTVYTIGKIAVLNFSFKTSATLAGYSILFKLPLTFNGDADIVFSDGANLRRGFVKSNGEVYNRGDSYATNTSIFAIPATLTLQ